MEITLTWHLLIMIVLSVLLIKGTFKSDNAFDFRPIINFLLLVILWAVYGGIVYW